MLAMNRGGARALIPATDEQMLAYVAGGVLRVDPDGSVWRCRRWQTGIGYGKWIASNPPTRCENLIHCRVMVPLCHDGIRLFMHTHRLVWITLIGPIPAGQHPHHKDGDRRNNHPDNLFLSSSPYQAEFVDVAPLFEVCRTPREELILATLEEHRTAAEAASALGMRAEDVHHCVLTLKRIRRRKDASE